MIHVIKADRRHEPFSEHKVMDSIRRARIPQSLHGEVLSHVKSKLYEGISTAEIYQHIMEFLNQSSSTYIKARYSLKEAIMMLGPSGYPFEDFVSKLLESEGYKTQVRQVLSGRCITHEIDILAEKDGRTAVIEAKFHNSPGTRSEVQVALYTHARYEDVKIRNSVHESWIVTNTKTTVDANTYAQCSGMKIISWDYPAGNSLREMIERSGLHPITMVTALSQSQKMTLLENHIVLCKDIADHPDLLDMLYLSKIDRERILKEVIGLSTTV
jgi:Holliday junction resolvase-like predicted endonuclease